MPFLTEELWAIKGEDGAPRASAPGARALARSSRGSSTRRPRRRSAGWSISSPRSARRARRRTCRPARRSRSCSCSPRPTTRARLERWGDTIRRLARLSGDRSADAPPPSSVQLIVRGEVAALPLEGIVDLAAERARLLEGDPEARRRDRQDRRQARQRGLPAPRPGGGRRGAARAERRAEERKAKIAEGSPGSRRRNGCGHATSWLSAGDKTVPGALAEGRHRQLRTQGSLDAPVRPHRQSRRDRLPDHPDGEAARDAHHRGPFGGGCGGALRPDGGRGASDRAGAGAGELSRIDRIIEVGASGAGAACIHPGYGFLSESAEFAEACAAAGIVFVGPPASADPRDGPEGRRQGARAQQAGVPVVPGYHGAQQEPDFLRQKADEIGYPVLIKAVAGGGGKGMRQVDQAGGFRRGARERPARGRRAPSAIRGCWSRNTCSRRATSRSRSSRDAHGNVVHLFERDCSLQRRHQKVIEEAPAPGMTRGDARRDGPGGGRGGARGRLCRRRHGRVHRRRARGAAAGPLLLHGDEHAAPGRASGDGGDHRARSRRAAVPRRGGRARCRSRRTTSRSTAMRSRRGSMRRIPEKGFLPSTGKLWALHFPERRGHPRRYRRRGRRRGDALLRPDDRQGDRPWRRRATRRSTGSPAALGETVVAGPKTNVGLPEAAVRGGRLPGGRVRHRLHRPQPRGARRGAAAGRRRRRSRRARCCLARTGAASASRAPRPCAPATAPVPGASTTPSSSCGRRRTGLAGRGRWRARQTLIAGLGRGRAVAAGSSEVRGGEHELSLVVEAGDAVIVLHRRPPDPRSRCTIPSRSISSTSTRAASSRRRCTAS